MASRSFLPHLLAGASVLSLALATLPAQAAGVPLLAHRAVYDMTLGKTSGTSSPVSARGRILYEFTGSACEGYSTSMRQVIQTETDEGSTRVMDMRNTSFEDGDGSTFRFKNDTEADGRLIDSIDGRARRSADGAVAVDLAKPAPTKTDLGPGAVFPTAQIVEIIAAANRGERTAAIKIYDGSDGGKKLFDTMTVIGPKATAAPAEKAAANEAALRDVARWPVSVSYFDPEKVDGAPNYVLAFDLYENGVSGRLRIDYGTYTLLGEMSKFEVLPQKPCN